jgi:hypothetical protein
MRRVVLALGALGVAACVESPTGAVADSLDDDPLALTFEELSRQAAAVGDVSRAQGFAFAAIAARSGVTPSRLDLRVGNTVEVYEAFVSSIDWSLAITSPSQVPAHRSVTAWRRTTDGVTRILTLTTPSDSAPVTNPLSLSPNALPAAAFAGASALYQETTSIQMLGSAAPAALADEFWIGMTGFVKIREQAAGAECPRPATAQSISGVTCRQARFLVKAEVSFQRLAQRPYQVQAGATPRRIATSAEQTIAGYKLQFACASVSPRNGCG